MRTGLKESFALIPAPAPAPTTCGPCAQPLRSLNIYSQRFVGVNFDVDFARTLRTTAAPNPSHSLSLSLSLLLSSICRRDNHLRLHLSLLVPRLAALVVSCEKCILPQFVALLRGWVCCGLGCTPSVDSLACISMQASQARPLRPSCCVLAATVTATAYAAAPLLHFSTKINMRFVENVVYRCDFSPLYTLFGRSVAGYIGGETSLAV